METIKQIWKDHRKVCIVAIAAAVVIVLIIIAA